MSESQAPADFGRVDADGTVYVITGDTERSVGQIPDSTPEEALAFYVRRFENLAAEVGLLEKRVEAQALSPEEAKTAIATARTNVEESNAVGDLASLLGGVPVIATGAGHDAGILAKHGIPTAMLFVRNPTGVSHAPEEFAETDDCLAGVRALARVIDHLAGAGATADGAP